MSGLVSAPAFWYLFAFGCTVMLAILFVVVLHLERIPMHGRIPVLCIGLIAYTTAVTSLLFPLYPR